MTPLFAILFSVVSILARIVEHVPNVAPIGALAFWSGVVLPKRWGWSVAIIAMLVSDAVVGAYDPRLMAVVYASFIVSTMIGWAVRRHRDPTTLLVATLAGSIFFFLSTNTAVWALSHWYPHTPEGLLLAYTYGLPFFRNSLLGDLLYTGVFFGVYELVAQHNLLDRWVSLIGKREV